MRTQKSRGTKFKSTCTVNCTAVARVQINRRSTVGKGLLNILYSKPQWNRGLLLTK